MCLNPERLTSLLPEGGSGDPGVLTRGAIEAVLDMGKFVPIAGGPIGAAIDAMSMKAVGRYARKNFAAHAEPR